MNRIDISKIDMRSHVKYFAEPLDAALAILSSDRGVLQIDGRQVSKLARSSDARAYFGVLYAISKKDGFMIATASPDQIDKLVQADELYCESRRNKGWVRPKQKRFSGRCSRIQKSVFRVLKTLFNYEKFSKGKGWKIKGSDIQTLQLKELGVEWGASVFQKAVVQKNKLRFCPYCNAETAFMLTNLDTRSRESRSPLDHFYPKSVFPYIGVSLYNLIPICAHCNSGLKREKMPWKHGRRSWIHPYAESFHECAWFRYAHIALKELYGAPVDSMTVEIQCKKDMHGDMANNLAESLQLVPMYNQAYKREINEIPARLQMALAYSPTLLSDLCCGSKTTKKTSKAMALCMNCSLSDALMHEERLSKLTIDLVAQLIGTRTAV